MKYRVLVLLALRLTLISMLIAAPTQAIAAESRVVGVVEDFSGYELGPIQKGHLDHWRWSDAEREQARLHSRVECVAGEADGAKRLRVRIDGAMPTSQRSLPFLRLAPHFPPEADVVVVHCRAVSGNAQLFVGGPTAYYADSDVFTDGEEVKTTDHPRNVIAEFSLNHPLRRNFRRAGFSTDARRIYYTRWAQEPIGIYIIPQSPCEFFIDRIELASVGEGRPFPEFAADQVHAVRTIADFEDGRLDRAFNLYMADGETEWFEQSWKRERPLRFAPPKLAVAADEERGAKSLVGTGRFAEEVHCAGVRTDGGSAEANALRITLAHNSPAYRNTVVGQGRAEPVDFFLFTAPPDKPFPWAQFEPDAELRRKPGPGFDYQFSYRAIRDRQDVDFAVYQTRRYVRPNEWTTLVLPAADFACVYGSGTYRDRFLADAATKLDDVVAVAWLTPWCRAGRQGTDVTTRVDELSFVTVPGEPSEHRSFWRIDDWRGAMWGDQDPNGRRILHLYLRGDGGPRLAPGP